VIDYPIFVYRKADRRREDNSAFETLWVSNESEHEAALSDGWSNDVISALAQKDKTSASSGNVDAVVGDDLPPTRDELETKAVELGLKFDGRTSDRKLALLIAEALGE
jgi:hypothetical protein